MARAKTQQIKKHDALLRSLYYSLDSSSAFSGKANVYKKAKKILPSITKRDVDAWFSKELAYTLHKPVRYKFTRNKTIVMSIDDQWQADLCDMSAIKKENDNNTFILTVIDCFSKYAWAETIRDKFGQTIVDAMKIIFKRSNSRRPKRFQTDKGKEFLNTKVQALLRENDIAFFTTHSEQKASIVERFNRTLKGRMYKYFTAQNTLRYVNVLQKLVDGYNNSYHRSIKMHPADVRESDQIMIRQHLYGGKNVTSKHYKYSIGDLVRISKARRVFKKGYLPGWTEQTYIIFNREHFTQPVYYLRTYDGENLEGAFYEAELQKVEETDEHRVEKVLQTKKRKDGTTLYLVKWKGWGDEYNSWVENIRRL